jgi:dTDP-4-amino-4,6-dideoxygalactose transaminase
MIPLAEPTLTGHEFAYLRRCLDENWLSSVGPIVGDFERRLAARAGRRHAVAVSSGTAALHLALVAAGVRPGDLVITQSFSFVATANAVALAGAVPLFLDSAAETWNMSPAALAEALGAARRNGAGLTHRPTGRRIGAVLPALIFGLTGGLGAWVATARAAGIPLVVDAAEAVGARHAGRAAESWGDISCVSFNGNKVMTTGSGGAILTDDDAIAARCRHLSTQAKADALDHVHDAEAFNYRMAAINAAVGLGQLDGLDDMLAAKRRIAERYRAAFAAIGPQRGPIGIVCMPRPEPDADWPWLFSVLLADGRAAVQRLNAGGIGARRLWRPLHLQPPYADRPRQEGGLPVAERLYAEGVSLPSSVGLDAGAQAEVVAAVRAVAAGERAR